MIRVLVLSNHPIVREGLVRLLGADDELRAQGRELGHQPAVVDEPPDVVLWPVEAGARVDEVVGHLRDAYPQARLLCLLLDDDGDAAVQALQGGAAGLIDSSVNPSEILDYISQVQRNQFVISNSFARRLAARYGSRAAVRAEAPEGDLTQREAEVLQLLAEGYSNREMAERLSVSEHTVRSHLRGIMQKLNVSNRVQAAAFAWQGRSAITKALEGKKRDVNPYS
jgi:DNA-binding NarL/FixJ family response regulator